MYIHGKRMTLEDLMVKEKSHTSAKDKPREFVWVGYSTSYPHLPVCVATSVNQLAAFFGVKPSTVRQMWSRYKHGSLKYARFAKVYLDDDKGGDWYGAD